MNPEGDLDLDCAVCGQSAALTGQTPVSVEHALTVWATLHAHDAEQRAAWYAVAAQHAGDWGDET